MQYLEADTLMLVGTIVAIVLGGAMLAFLLSSVG